MRSSTKSELQMLRELAWYFLPQTRCDLCNRLIILAIRKGGLTFGHRRHPPITMKVTVHHINRNRQDNRFENLALVHTICHRRYHAKTPSR